MLTEIESGKPEGQIVLEKSKRKWWNNVKLNVKHIGCSAVGWVLLARNRLPVVIRYELGNEFPGFLRDAKFLD